MKLKPEVDSRGVDREIWFALGVADGIRDHLVVSALRDGKHKVGSLHYAGRAADIRVNDLPEPQRNVFVAKLKEKLEPLGFDVVLELDPLHVHVEFDPKPGEEFIRRTEAP